MIYLGTPGRMVGLKCPASQSVVTSGEPSFRTTLEGRIKAQAPPRSDRRVWALQTSDATTAAQISAIQNFASGAWGPGPFVFVSADAINTNMLTPDVASCDPLVPNAAGVEAGGPMLLPDGSWAPRSYLRAAPGLFLLGRTRSPVLPGVPVSAAVTVLGAGAVTRISWYTANPDSTLALISHSRSTVVGLAGAPVRSYVTAVPPAGAVSCIVGVENGVQVTQPSLLWGDVVPMEWAAGDGCAKALAHGPSRDLVLTSRDRTFSNLSFTITEVG